MSDLIDRQAAIDAIEREQSLVERPITETRWFDLGLRKAQEVLSGLPTAQPELDEWCTDCKEYDQERHCCPRWNRVIRETLKDAELERKKGRWHITDAYPHNVYCSECHVKFAQTHWAVWEDGSLPRNFCPNCGADMRQKEGSDV